MQQFDTLFEYFDHWVGEYSDQVWLRELNGETATEYSWSDSSAEVYAAAAALEQRFGRGVCMLMLSKNRPHWFFADLAIIRSGNITVPLFTTQKASVTKYIADFTDAKVIFIGESENTTAVLDELSSEVTLVTLPGVTVDRPHITWQQLLEEGEGVAVRNEASPDDVISYVFTSGTTGMPKGVIQTHECNVVPVRRAYQFLGITDRPRYFSYLPLSHIAERQIVEFSSVICGGEVTFNESLETMLPDLQKAKPNVFFGAPRIWERMQQAIIEKFGGLEAFNVAIEADPKGIGELVIAGMGLEDVRFCLSAAAPISPALLEWWQSLGLPLYEGFGQTEAMGLIMSTPQENKVGSVGKPVGDVEVKLADGDELVIRSAGLSPGYYKQPDKTAELLQDGWLHTGDKAKIDENGFIYITGRVKDFFKTIHGKFVSPIPLEARFSENPYVEQQCLLGRGFSKTVMIATLSEAGLQQSDNIVEEALRESVATINNEVEQHARIGAVILADGQWTIDNDMMTPTLKLKRNIIEEKYVELAEKLSKESIQQKAVLLSRA